MVALAVGLALVAGEVGQVLNDAARARTAADAAALAGAAGGHERAVSVATSNGGHLISYVEEMDESNPNRIVVTVSVEVGRVSRTARAEGVTEWTAG